MTTTSGDNSVPFANFPDSIDWKVGVALTATRFFALGKEHANALAVLGKSDPPGVFQPFTLMEFLTYLSRTGWGSQSDNAFTIDCVVRELHRVGILTMIGAPSAAPLFGQSYALVQHVTAAQATGILWLAPALGAELLVRTVGSLTIPVTGTDQHGDPHVGTGILLDQSHVLTCAHVVNGMSLDAVLVGPSLRPPLNMNGNPTGEIQVVDKIAHPTADVAVITVDLSASTVEPAGGIAFREPVWADRVSLFGYPPVPFSTTAPLIVQMGEVVSPSVTLFGGVDVFLYSATTRPGNSGGPVVAHDGRIVGMVIQELGKDSIAPTGLPYYAALPTSQIVSALEDLGLGGVANVETWKV